MKKIDIIITKAEISSFSVELAEDYPRVTATIKLMTEQGKEITSYSLSSNTWQDHLKFDLPIEMITPIKEIGKQLEVIVANHCQNSMKQLEYIEVKKWPYRIKWIGLWTASASLRMASQCQIAYRMEYV